MDNRLHLNFNRGEPGAAGYENDDTYQASNERVYPTTPSTFPQPVFQNQAQANSEYLSGGTQSPTGGYPGGANYFSNNLYQAQYAQPQPQQQQQAQQQQQQQQHQQQQGQYSNQYQQGITPQSQRQGGLNTNDPTTGLARQFSNQNLGSSQQRQLGPFNRQPSPNTTSRPRTGDLRSQQSYGSTLSPSLVQPGGLGQSGAMEDPPEQNFDKYSSNVAKRVVGLHVHVQAFFKDNISRARERNTR
jgi:protein-serine/threonine kinase